MNSMPAWRNPRRAACYFMNKILINKLVILLFLTIFSTSCSEPVAQREGLGDALPVASGLNVLVISFDALRADALGLYGYHRPTSPRLDAFAKEALVFENAYTAAPVTPTSFASAFTGQYPYKVFVGWQLLPSDTLAEAMQAAGYSTFALLNNVQVVAERHFDQGWETFETGPWRQEEELVARSLELIDESLDGEAPYFGWVHFISPHTPYDYRELTAHLAPPMDEGRYARSAGGDFDIKDEHELARVRDLYDGEVWYADWLFGQILDHLEATGALDSTIVVVTSDHGEEFMDHGQVQHNAMYEELVRIPMIIRHPGAPTGMRTDIPYINVDLMPTLLSTLGLPAPEAIDGVDLRSPFAADRIRVVTGMTNGKRFEILTERDGLKLMQICTPEYREKLYDLNTDPGEQHDILLDRPDIANALDEALRDLTQTEPCELIRAVTQGKAPEDLLSPEQIEELKSLGYIQ